MPIVRVIADLLYPAAYLQKEEPYGPCRPFQNGNHALPILRNAVLADWYMCLASQGGILHRIVFS